MRTFIFCPNFLRLLIEFRKSPNVHQNQIFVYYFITMALPGFPLPDFEFESDELITSDNSDIGIEISPEEKENLHQQCGLTLRSPVPIKSSTNSSVFIAESTHDGSVCALKVTPHKRRIQHEYSNRKQIPDSPYLVRSNYIFESPSRAILKMEFCQYGDIRSKKYDSLQIINIIHDIGSALQIIHSHGFLHLDVSPGNILFSGKCFKLTDFGTMIPVGEFTDGCEGAGPYVSPEALSFPSNQFPVFYPTDIFSFGVTLLEAATGIPAPRGGSSGYNKLRNDQIKLGEGKYVTDIDPSIISIINSMLKFDPNERPTASDLVSFSNSVNI